MPSKIILCCFGSSSWWSLLKSILSFFYIFLQKTCFCNMLTDWLLLLLAASMKIQLTPLWVKG